MAFTTRPAPLPWLPAAQSVAAPVIRGEPPDQDFSLTMLIIAKNRWNPLFSRRTCRLKMSVSDNTLNLCVVAKINDCNFTA
jgi:hypothetical protein